MQRDLETAVEAFIERFGCGALAEAVSRYRDSILEGKAQQALAWRSIAHALEDLNQTEVLRSMH